jgi:hypothetical protein
MTLMIRLIVSIVLICAAGCSGQSGQVTPRGKTALQDISFPGTEAATKQINGFKIGPDNAFKLAEAFSTSHSERLAPIREWWLVHQTGYFFSMYKTKDGVRLKGYVVDGNTGEVKLIEEGCYARLNWRGAVERFRN